MAQQHLDRLSSVDAGFLHQEDGRNSHMHIGGIGIFEGPAPSEAELYEHVARRLKLVPRFRQRLAFPPLGSGRPLWVDDPNFNLRYHVRRTGLPQPGNEEQLMRLTSRVISQRLDRTKPLWEMWVIEGLADGQWAVLTKTHHCLVDGVGGVDIMTALVDLTRETRDVGPDDWEPQPTPSSVGLVEHGAVDVVRTARTLTGQVFSRMRHPQATVEEVTDRVLALGEVGRNLLLPAPSTPLNRRVSPHRVFASVRARLGDFKEVKDALGGTLNDAVLAVVSGALRRYLAELGSDVDSIRLRACVPMSIRGADQQGGLGNQITIMVAELPTDLADPLDRLRFVTRSMQRLKRSRQAVGARTLTQMEEWMPPNVLAQASRLGFMSRIYNLLVTNVPGPQFPVYLLGREMVDVTPIAFLAPEHCLAVAVLSYNGRINFGLLGDADALGELEGLAGHVHASLDELVSLARASRPAA